MAQSWDKRTGLAPLLAQRVGLTGPAPATLDAVGASYGLAAIRQEEQARSLRQRARQEALRAQLVTGPVLTVPVTGAAFAFNPTTVTPLPPIGAAYGTLRVATKWGVLAVTKAGLLSDDWTRLSVSLDGAALTPDGMMGDGWVLTLKPGWQLMPGVRPQDRAIGSPIAAGQALGR